MIDLLVMCPNPKDATSFYRGMGPLLVMRHQDDKIKLHLTDNYSWVNFHAADVFMMQRPYTEDHFSMLEMAHANRVPVWVDFDDDLFSVPQSNPAHKIYGRPNIMKTIAKLIANADVVTVSTQFLKEKLERFETPLNKDIRVVHNAFNNHRIKPKESLGGPRNKLIMWRGSHTHHEDLWEVQEQLVQLATKNPDWTFHFQGDRPWFLAKQMPKNVIFGDPIDPMEYFQLIHKLKPVAVMVPLKDSEFNRSKSNIAWIEASYAGAVTIAPDWEEWQKPGALNYKTPGDFQRLVQSVINGSHDVEDLNRKSWEYITEHLCVDHVNLKRIQLIKDLCQKSG